MVVMATEVVLHVKCGSKSATVCSHDNQNGGAIVVKATQYIIQMAQRFTSLPLKTPEKMQQKQINKTCTCARRKKFFLKKRSLISTS